MVMVLLSSPYEKKYDVPDCDVIRTNDERQNRRYNAGALLLLLIVTLVCACFFLIVVKCSLKDERRLWTGIDIYWDDEMARLNFPDGHVLRIVVTNRNSGRNGSWLFERREISEERLELAGQQTLFSGNLDKDPRPSHVRPGHVGITQDALRELMAEIVDSARVGKLIPVNNSPTEDSSYFMDEVGGPTNGVNATASDSNNSRLLSDISAAVDDGSVVYIQLIPLNVSETPKAADNHSVELTNSTDNISTSNPTPPIANATENSRAEQHGRGGTEASAASEAPRNGTESEENSLINGKLGVDPVTARRSTNSSALDANSLFQRMSSRLRSVFKDWFI